MNTNTDTNPVSRDSLARRHEAGDPSLRPAVQVALLVPLITGTSLAIIGWILIMLSPDKPDPLRSKTPAKLVEPDPSLLNRFPAPRLQLSPRYELTDGRILEQQRLETYGWVNRTAGVIHIPISRAMDIIVDRGLPVRSTNAPAPQGISSLELIRQRSQNR